MVSVFSNSRKKEEIMDVQNVIEDHLIILDVIIVLAWCLKINVFLSMLQKI